MEYQHRSKDSFVNYLTPLIL